MIKSFLANAAALALATYLLSGITLEGDDWQPKATSLAIIAAIFGVLNAFVKPLLTILSVPFILLTLGLFLWVINAGMLMLTSNLSERFGVGWHVDGWGTAFWGALIITIVSGWVGGILKRSAHHR